MIINKVHLILLIKCPERSAVFNVPKRYLGRHILHVRLCQQVYKNANHKKNVCQSALCTDVETNPGPVFYIDPSKTISAPYSQGNQIIFGETTTAVFSICLCTLIYNKRYNICSPQDLVQIMNSGNKLYSNLTRQSFLLLYG